MKEAWWCPACQTTHTESRCPVLYPEPKVFTLAEVRERERAAWANGHFEGYGKGILDAVEHHVNYVATQRWAEAEALRRYGGEA